MVPVTLLALGTALAQVPTGTIAGVVADPSGASVPAARIAVRNAETGLNRTVESSTEGNYSVAALPAGVYVVSAAARGFRVLERQATVEAGTTTSVDLAMQVGAANESVTVDDASPLLQHDHHQVGGVVTREQIDRLPLNGRNFLELAKLEPGATQNFNRGSFNRQFTPLLAAPSAQQGSRTRVTVDGGSVMSPVTGGSQMGFSQEVVQEFQVSSANFDLSTGVTASGSINIVTRPGGNQLHGSGFFFFRDHKLSAYPGLSRDPSNPDPFFQRRQSGFALGGPIRKDRAFFFVNLERNNQRGVVSVQPLTPEFAAFGQIAPNPYRATQFSSRFDVRLSQNHNAFVRYSHDGLDTVEPSVAAATLPSSWVRRPNWSDQSLGALTSVLAPNLVNDLRFSYYFNSSGDKALRPEDCPAPCLGRGLPSITLNGTDILIGNSGTGGNVARRYQLNEDVSWQRKLHRMRFGVDWEHTTAAAWTLVREPAGIVLYSPEAVRQYNAQAPASLQVPLPAAFRNAEDILQLPLRNFSVDVGSRIGAALPKARTWDLWHLYWQDAWHVQPRLTIDYGLAWSYERGNLTTDLTRPAYLAPIFGANGLRPAGNDPNNFSPSVGFAWTATGDHKTVVRGGAGIYYDPDVFGGTLENERADLAPAGNGRSTFQGSGILNPIAGIPGVAVGTALDFRSVPTLLTGANLLQALPGIRDSLLRLAGNPGNTDLSIRNIQVQKSGGALVAPGWRTSYAEHASIGVQRELTRNLAVSADYVFRQFMHVRLISIDYNHYNSIRGPVIPKCAAAQLSDPKAQCSNGAILVDTNSGRTHYEGLVLRVEKRFAGRTQFLASYAFTSDAGFRLGGTMAGLNLDDWSESYGPGITRRHVLNLSGILVDLVTRRSSLFPSSMPESFFSPDSCGLVVTN
jgi:hypothetical protein